MRWSWWILSPALQSNGQYPDDKAGEKAERMVQKHLEAKCGESKMEQK